MQHLRPLRSDSGFTMIEVLVATTILITGILGALSLFDRAAKNTVETRAREGATGLARDLTEAARGIQYDRIAQNTIVDVLAAQPGLEDADPSNATYELVRRGITYTATLGTCVMDDARDGGGDQAAGGFCPDSVPPNTPPSGGGATSVDRNPEDYKQVTVTVAWTKNHLPRTVRQDVIVNNPGSSAGPAVRLITVDGVATPVIETGDTARLRFETSYRPETTNWFVDAAVQTPKPTATGLRSFEADWVFTALEDGTYVLGAVAYDKYGVAGQGKSVSVKLNRHWPKQPTGLVGGRNGDTLVELSWLANLEKDIVGYTVERSTDGGLTWAQLCPLASATSCQDTAPPPPGADGAIRYRVFPHDSNADGTPRRGLVPSDELILPEDNAPPAAPEAAQVVHRVDGTSQITWTRPADDPADPIAFYRIYRDGQELANRYATSDATTQTVEFVDGDTGGVTHDYWISAVDRWFLESPKVRAQEAG